MNKAKKKLPYLELHLVPALRWKHLLQPMINLNLRSYQKELLDLDDIPFADIRQNMKELNLINTYLGGHTISISGIKKILQTFKHDKPITVCEIGCGGGDNLKAIEKWCISHSINVSFIGIDMKRE